MSTPFGQGVGREGGVAAGVFDDQRALQHVLHGADALHHVGQRLLVQRQGGKSCVVWPATPVQHRWSDTQAAWVSRARCFSCAR